MRNISYKGAEMQFKDLPDILLISVDSMRRDAMAPYGQDLMPRVSHLLDKGISFDKCFAASPWTGASFGSLHTGLWPRQHCCSSVTKKRGQRRMFSLLKPEARTIAQMLSNVGYHTICSQGNPGHIGHGSGFNKGFDHFFSWYFDLKLGRTHRELRSLASALAHGRFWRYASFASRRILKELNFRHFTLHWPMSEGQMIVQKAMQMLRQSPQDRPVFLWINFMDMHSPYSIPGRPLPKKEVPTKIRPIHLQPRIYPDVEYEECDKICTRTIYDKAAIYINEQIENLLHNWRFVRQKRSRLTIFTSDHGEEFWEHGSFSDDPWFYRSGVEHGHTLYNELIHVPLIMHWPDVYQRNQRINTLVSLTDVVPTIIDLLELDEDTSEMTGTSLVNSTVSRSADSDTNRVIFAEFLTLGRERKAAISATHKLIKCPETGEIELYAWIQDPKEKKDLSQSPHHYETLKHLSDALENWENSLEHSETDLKLTEQNDEMTKRLQALGYL